MKDASSQKTRKVLGKGLSALIPELREEEKRAEALVDLDLDLIAPNPLQPRKSFDASELEALARSIKEQGVLSPILVRPSGSRYEIVAGERRWRAAQMAGLERVPALIRTYHKEKLLEVALVENIQRSELNAIEEANAYRMLIDEFQVKHEEVARRVGRDRTSITNSLRLLKLSPAIQALVMEGKLQAGHARALLCAEDLAAREKLARRAVAEDLSVRALERLATAAPRDRPGSRARRGRHGEPDANVRHAAERLQTALATKVRIEKDGKGGRIVIEFYSDEELMRLFDRLVK